MKLQQIEPLLLQEMEEVKGGGSGICVCKSGAGESTTTGGVCECESAAGQQILVGPAEPPRCLCTGGGAAQNS